MSNSHTVYLSSKNKRIGEDHFRVPSLSFDWDIHIYLPVNSKTVQFLFLLFVVWTVCLAVKINKEERAK